MKLKDGFVLHTAGDENMMVATGAAAKVFNGLVRNNDTAQFILKQLQENITEEEIVKRMCETYDAPEDKIAEDVHKILEKMKKSGFLDE